MTNCSYSTALALEVARMPRPYPSVGKGQMWYLPKLGSFPGGEYPPHIINYVLGEEVFFSSIGGLVDDKRHVGNMMPAHTFLAKATFAPTLDYIIAHLKPGFLLEIWDGRPSCSNRDDADPIRTQANTFTEAAALMWLAQNEKEHHLFENESPGSDISKPGDIEQE